MRTRRRQIIVDKPFQWRATLVGMTYMVAITMIVVLPLLAVMRSNGMQFVGRGDMLDLYQTQQRFVALSLAVFTVGVTGIWVFLNLWRTHKIAGPVVKMTRFLHNVSTGDFCERITLRTDDELQGLAGAINGMVESLEERDETMRRDLLEIARSGSMDRLVGFANSLSHKAPDSKDTEEHQSDPEREPLPTA